MEPFFSWSWIKKETECRTNIIWSCKSQNEIKALLKALVLNPQWLDRVKLPRTTSANFKPNNLTDKCMNILFICWQILSWEEYDTLNQISKTYPFLYICRTYSVFPPTFIYSFNRNYMYRLMSVFWKEYC